MQEKRPNIVLGYRADQGGEPIQTLIGPMKEEKCLIFDLSTGETTVFIPQEDESEQEPFIPCDDETNEKIFKMMRKKPAVYVKFCNVLNQKIPR